MVTKGVIYILTNPTFPEYVKISYANNLEQRMKDFNQSEALPFAFRVYVIYEVCERLTDKKLHDLIDTLNPDLRTVENFDGKERKREFYAMSKEDVLASIDKVVDASIELRGKKELIHNFINLYSLHENGEIHDTWQRFINTERENELTKIIEDNNLNPAETRRLIPNSFRDGVFKTTGTDVDRIMPAMSRFGDNNRSGKKKSVIERLVIFFEKYFGAI